MQNYSLTELIEPDVLQQIQNTFSEYTGMASVTTDADGVPVTSVSCFSRFCSEIVRGSRIGLAKCQRCDRNGATDAMCRESPAVYTCHAGLVDFAAPIMLNGIIIGCFIGGQVLTEKPDEQKCRSCAEEYGIDPQLYISEINKSSKTTQENVERSANLLFGIAKALSAMAAHKCAQIESIRSIEIAARSQSDYIMGLTSDLTSVSLDYMETAREALDSGDPTQMKTALETITSRGTGASEMIRDSLTYLQMIGRRFRMSEEEYEPRKVFTGIVKTINSRADMEAELILELDERVPQLLLGDAGGICQILDKLAVLLSEKGSRKIEVNISSSRHSYAEMLKISLRSSDADINKSYADKIRRIVSADDNYSAESMSELSLSIVKSQLRSMSGKFDIEYYSGVTEISFTIPQLKIEGDASR